MPAKSASMFSRRRRAAALIISFSSIKMKVLKRSAFRVHPTSFERFSLSSDVVKNTQLPTTIATAACCPVENRADLVVRFAICCQAL
jgi:hypothetical protein